MTQSTNNLIGILVSIISLTACVYGWLNRPHSQFYQFCTGVNVGLLAIHTHELVNNKRREKETRERIQQQEQESQKSLRGENCQKCHYYHGSKYGGVFLICAVHPQGQENCADFVEKSAQKS